jgi:hypothetical protein
MGLGSGNLGRVLELKGQVEIPHGLLDCDTYISQTKSLALS